MCNWRNLPSLYMDISSRKRGRRMRESRSDLLLYYCPTNKELKSVGLFRYCEQEPLPSHTPHSKTYVCIDMTHEITTTYLSTHWPTAGAPLLAHTLTEVFGCELNTILCSIFTEHLSVYREISSKFAN